MMQNTISQATDKRPIDSISKTRNDYNTPVCDQVFDDDHDSDRMSTASSSSLLSIPDDFLDFEDFEDVSEPDSLPFPSQTDKLMQKVSAKSEEEDIRATPFLHGATLPFFAPDAVNADHGT